MVRPALGEPLPQRLAHPRVTAGHHLAARVDVDEPRVDDDAVGVVDAQLALVGDGHVRLDAQPPAHVGCLAAHLVHRAGPLGDAQARLLLDLAREALDEALAVVDHPAGRCPVVAAVAAAVLHEQHARRRSG